MDEVAWEGEHLPLCQALAFLERPTLLGEMMEFLEPRHRSLMLSQSLATLVERLTSVIC